MEDDQEGENNELLHYYNLKKVLNKKIAIRQTKLDLAKRRTKFLMDKIKETTKVMVHL